MESIAAYLPHDRRLDLAYGRKVPTQTRGAALFADVSGFTPLTEALSRTLGPRRGAEELSAQLNRVYDALIAEVERYSGSVIGFAGDAITCWFADDEPMPEGTASAALRATSCALMLQQAMRRFATVELPDKSTTALALKVAIASGSARRYVIGDPAIQQMDVLAGVTLDRMAAAEHEANKGEVIVDEPTWAQLEGYAQLSEWRVSHEDGARFAVIRGLSEPAPPTPWPAIPPGTLREQGAVAWMLPPVAERLTAGFGEFLTELRPSVPLFLRFGGIDFDNDEEAEQKLNTFICLAQQTLLRYDGWLLQLTVGDKGCYLYTAFGAPVAHEDDPQRAVMAALDLRDLPAKLPFIPAVQIGITMGTTRTGAYGGPTRRTYGVLGDEVNLAARLMQRAAPGEVLAGSWVQEATPGFKWEPLDPVIVKGKSKPITIARLIGRRLATSEDRAFRGEMVGRTTELEQFADLVQPIFAGRFAGVTSIFGEAGAGKSRLVYELRQRLASDPATQCRCMSCFAEGIVRQSLNPFRMLLRDYFGLHADEPEAIQRKYIDDLIDGLMKENRADEPYLAADLDRARSFLGALLDLRWDGSLYELLEPKLRFENTLYAVRSLILAESRRNPVLLVVEDAHWLDEDSRALLRVLTQEVGDYPFALVLTGRYDDSGGRFMLPLDDDVPQQAIDLAALPAAEMRQLAEELLGGSVNELLATFVAEKTSGNPFFIEQLLLDLHERGLLTRGEDGWQGAADVLAEVPASINALLIARLDRLVAQVKATVQTAAVLGIEFDVRVLARVLHDTESERLPDWVDIAESEAVWSALTELRYLFRQGLLRDAAYDMQLHARLCKLHALAGEALEQIYASDLDAYAADITYHYGRAGLDEPERRFATLAGEYAAARYANAAAVRFFSRALELTPADDSEGRYRLLLAREQVYDRQGDRETQLADLVALETLAAQLDDVHRQIEVALRMANYRSSTGDYHGVITAAQRVIGLASETESRADDAAGHLQWARALWFLGDYEAARTQGEQALSLARAASERQLEAHVLRNLGNIAIDQGEYTVARSFYEQGLKLHRELNDRQGESYTLNNLGIVAFYLTDYARARSDYEQSLAIKHEIGDRYGQSLALVNLGEVAFYQGDYSSARLFYEQTLRLCRATNNPLVQSISLVNLGDIAATLGDYDSAAISLDDALRISRELGHRQQECLALARLALLLHRKGDQANAEQLGRQALHLAEEINDRNTQGTALTALGHALAALGRLNEAAEIYWYALGIRHALNQPSLAMECLAGLARVTLASGDDGEALIHVDEILGYLQNADLDGADEPFRIYLTCYQVLDAVHDPRAGEVLERAYNQLHQQSLAIADPAARQAFLERVPAHRELVAARAAQSA